MKIIKTSLSLCFICCCLASNAQQWGDPPVQANTSWSIAPNPAKSFVNFTANYQSPTTITIMVYNSAGIPVISRQVPNLTTEQFKLDLEDAPPGVYIITVKENETTTSRKIVVAR